MKMQKVAAIVMMFASTLAVAGDTEDGSLRTLPVGTKITFEKDLLIPANTVYSKMGEMGAESNSAICHFFSEASERLRVIRADREFEVSKVKEGATYVYSVDLDSDPTASIICSARGVLKIKDFRSVISGYAKVTLPEPDDFLPFW